MTLARTELIQRVEGLLAARKRGEPASNGNFSEDLTLGIASQAYTTDPLYRAVMHFADAFSDSWAHGFPQVDQIEFDLATQMLQDGVEALAGDTTEIPAELLRYV